MALHAYRFFADGDTPLAEAFWALRFGTCTDRFGTSWMVSVDHPSAAVVADHASG